MNTHNNHNSDLTGATWCKAGYGYGKGATALRSPTYPADTARCETARTPPAPP